MKKPVRTKRDFVLRYSSDEFGNASPTWDNYESWVMACGGKSSRYHIRNRIAGGLTWYDVSAHDMPRMWREACRTVDADNLYISEMAPTSLTLIQGEVRRSVGYLDLTYSRQRMTMREALRTDTAYANGSAAVALLRYYMDNNSWEWLNYLLDEYDDHVIEFSTYAVEWGTIPGFNTVFWEVRGGY